MQFAFAVISILVSIVALLLLIVRLKVHPFIALVAVAVALGIVFRIPLVGDEGILHVLATALGPPLAHILPLVGLGCIVGEIISRSGGSELLGMRLLRMVGAKRGALALALAGLLVGSTIFFDTAVILLAPVAIAVARQAKRNVAYFALPMAISALSVHAVIAPHPGAVAVASGLGADFGLMAAFGLAAMLPGAALGCWWAYRQVGRIDVKGGLLELNEEDRVGGHHAGATTTATATVPQLLPRLVSVLLLPVVLILSATIAQTFTGATGAAASIRDFFRFVGTPEFALIITTVVAYLLLLPKKQRRATGLSEVGRVGLRPVGEIVLSTGGGVAFGGVIGAAGIGATLVESFESWHVPLLLFGFILAVVLRATLGTTTAAVTTVAALLASSVDLSALGATHVALLAVAIAAGGVCLSHVNDAGFWVLSRYFGISEITMLRTWTVGVTIMGVVCMGITTVLWFALPN